MITGSGCVVIACPTASLSHHRLRATPVSASPTGVCAEPEQSTDWAAWWTRVRRTLRPKRLSVASHVARGRSQKRGLVGAGEGGELGRETGRSGVPCTFAGEGAGRGGRRGRVEGGDDGEDWRAMFVPTRRGSGRARGLEEVDWYDGIMSVPCVSCGKEMRTECPTSLCLSARPLFASSSSSRLPPLPPAAHFHPLRHSVHFNTSRTSSLRSPAPVVRPRYHLPPIVLVVVVVVVVVLAAATAQPPNTLSTPTIMNPASHANVAGLHASTTNPPPAIPRRPDLLYTPRAVSGPPPLFPYSNHASVGVRDHPTPPAPSLAQGPAFGAAWQAAASSSTFHPGSSTGTVPSLHPRHSESLPSNELPTNSTPAHFPFQRDGFSLPSPTIPLHRARSFADGLTVTGNSHSHPSLRPEAAIGLPSPAPFFSAAAHTAAHGDGGQTSVLDGSCPPSPPSPDSGFHSVSSSPMDQHDASRSPSPPAPTPGTAASSSLAAEECRRRADARLLRRQAEQVIARERAGVGTMDEESPASYLVDRTQRWQPVEKEVAEMEAQVGAVAREVDNAKAMLAEKADEFELQYIKVLQLTIQNLCRDEVDDRDEQDDFTRAYQAVQDEMRQLDEEQKGRRQARESEFALQGSPPESPVAQLVKMSRGRLQERLERERLHTKRLREEIDTANAQLSSSLNPASSTHANHE